MEAMRAVFAIFAQTSTTGGQFQGGLSNLQRFRSHHSPTFTEGGDSIVADHWFRQIEKVLEAMKVTFDVTRIMLPAF